MAWTIEYLQSVQKTVRKLDPQTRKRLRDFLEQRLLEAEDPRQIGKALKGSQLGQYWRYRVGDYSIGPKSGNRFSEKSDAKTKRVICDIQDQRLVVLVVEIGHRSGVYR
ncbi:type II toxin-antitoxin system RelE family toxin [Agrobacterium vitis]